MRVRKPAITERVWRKIKKGDGIRDAHKRIWPVINKDPVDNTIFVRHPVLDSEEQLSMENGRILDQSGSIILELTGRSVSVVRA